MLMIVFAIAGTLGACHGLGKAGLIPAYGYDRDRIIPPLQLVMALTLGAGFAAMIADSERGMAIAGLGSLGAFRLGDYAGGTAAWILWQ